ncbi:glycosyltransferase family 9 protein [Nocardioides aquiterrae]|uniref:Glycosyltransferase family 9 protein n=1 Tax=Nocardioides aquiterrae TaxID=203799 RepID=A0ABP4F7V5_9ACTN
MTGRALFLRALGLGDFLTGVPALRAARRALPGHEIVLAAPAALRPLVERCGAVDALLPTGELEPVPWAGPPPELAVDLHGNGPASRRLLDALGAGRVVAYDGDGPPWDPDEHERARWCRLVSWALAVDADPDALRLPAPPPTADAGAVVVHPGAASGSRRWPAARYAAVARWASGLGERVVVTGGASEAALAEQVRGLAGLPPTATLAGRTDLEQLAAVVAHARLVVCGDTGVAHLASAYGTPSVVLFGPTPPHRWGPPPTGPHTALWHGTRIGDPHADRPDPALLRIGVGEVVDVASVRLEGAPAAAGRPPTRWSG